MLGNKALAAGDKKRDFWRHGVFDRPGIVDRATTETRDAKQRNSSV
jgi:hypothetical protein